MEEWCWDGTIWDFAEIVQWAFVFRQLGKDKPVGWSEMVSNPEMIKQKAAEYGITLRAVTHEMLRIGTDLKNMYAAIDARNKNQQSDDMPEKKTIIVRNAIRCNHCGDVIESNYTHDFKTCSCRKVAVDGGHDYWRRCAASSEDYTDLSETAPAAENDD